MSVPFASSLMESIPDLVQAVIALFIIVDPVGNIPIFISLTKNFDKNQRKRVFRSAALTGFFLLIVFALAVQWILTFFSISVYSFMIAGGLLLLVIAIKLLIEGEWHEPAGSLEKLSAVPIAVPLLVGPGAITTTIFSIQNYGLIITIMSVVIVFFFVWVMLRLIDPIYKFLGNSGSSIIARIMALLIAAIAIQYIINGISYYSPMV
ncbi:MAG: MarC family protein [Candidatus Bathyarchaeota archaeon]|nr:MarC family protein [Candidatus Bathyarchaeota archaeon]